MEEVKVIEYDPEADVLTINVVRAPRVKEDRLLDNDLVLSYDEEGRLVQLQVLDASKRGLLDALAEILSKRPDIKAVIT